MPDILDNVRTYLKTKSAVTDLVGATTSSRIYIHEAKQDANLPFIVLHGFEGISEQWLSGVVGNCTTRVQVDCYASTRAGAYALAEAVRLAPLQMFRGAIGSCTALTVDSSTSYESGSDPPEPGSAQKRYWVSRDYIIRYTEATS